MPQGRRSPALTVYCGRAGDHNDLAMSGALVLGEALSRRLGLPATLIGQPAPAHYTDWQTELALATPDLRELSAHLDTLMQAGCRPLTVLSRCAAALATLPVVMKHRPDAAVVWFDAHGDLNTPQTTLSGYLGGMALAGPAGLWNSGFGNGLALANVILVGARDLDPAEAALIEAGMLGHVPVCDDAPALLSAALGGRPAFVHVDCDVLEPGIVPTDYRVAGGLSLAAFSRLCEVLAKAGLLGLEIAEFESAWPDNGAPASPTPLLDALAPLFAVLAVPDSSQRPAA